MVRQQDTKRMAKQWQEKSKVWQGTVKAQSRSSQGAVNGQQGMASHENLWQFGDT